MEAVSDRELEGRKSSHSSSVTIYGCAAEVSHRTSVDISSTVSVQNNTFVKGDKRIKCKPLEL